jgi:hypothetical protein
MHRHGPNSSPRDIAGASRGYVDEQGVHSAHGPELECCGILVLALFAITVFRFGLFGRRRAKPRKPFVVGAT